MKKIFSLLIALLGVFCFTNVYAEQLDAHSAPMIVDGFVECLNDGEECVFNFVDKSNVELVKNIEKFIHGLDVDYYVTKVEKVTNDHFIVKIRINAEGPGWSVSGFTAKFDVKNIDGKNMVTETTLFDNIGPEAVTRMVLTIFKIVGIILVSVFGLIAIAIVVVILMVKKKK